MNEKSYIRAVVVTIVGGVGLFLSTVFLNMFITSPPTRAEYNTFKAVTLERNKTIDRRLKNLENGQQRILREVLKTK